MGDDKPVRLQEIADKAGVCRATVSLALRNHPSLPLSTRQRIRQLADKLGYRPNPLVSTLMSLNRRAKATRPKHLTLAFVTAFSHRDPWNFYLSADLITGAAASAEKQGYHLEEFWLGDLKMTTNRLSEILYQRGVPGMIIAPLSVPRGELEFDWSHFAAVAIGQTLAKPDLHRVSTNRFQAMRRAIRHLREKGYRRLGLAIDINQDARVDHQWAAAFEWEQQQSKAAQRTKLFLVENEDWTPRNFADWFKKNRPEVVLGYDPKIISWLTELGFSVPKEVGFVHLWNPDQSGKFAGLYHNPPAIGAAAVDFLTGMIQRNERGVPLNPQTSLLEARWVDGATLRNL
jgi:LacI family transcriptional regulator